MQDTNTLTDKYFTEINQITNVSRETFELLNEFMQRLLKWNNKINLISKSHTTLDDIWTRHLMDSAQLIKYIPKDTKIITDFGSGGGFPGLVLAILGNWQVHMIESDQRKCAFLNEIAALIPIKPQIHNERAENITPWKTDVITCRALAPMDKLLKLMHRFIEKNKLCVFLKGQNVVEELNKVSKCWDIEYKIHPSITDDSGKVLIIKNIVERRRSERS